jgi:DDE superfamily endonuclease/Helix-turn-helix of DDE superfamily endonuclease
LRTEHMTGLSQPQLTELVALVHERPETSGKRVTGPALGLYRSVAMVVALLRQNLTQECAADIFEVSQSTVSRRWTALRGPIADALQHCTPEPSEAARGCTVLLDGTLIPCWDWAHRTDLFSGKHRDTGFNVQVAATLTGRLIAVGAPVPGARHDAHAYTASGIAASLAGLHVLADLGYVGCGPLTGTRKPASAELSADRNEANKDLSRVRAVIENVISWLKNWKMLSTRYRGPLHAFPEVLRAIVNLYHFARS